MTYGRALTSTIKCPLRSWAQRYGKRPALIGVDMTISYEQLDGWVDSVAYRLQKSGVGHGDRVALICPTRWEYPILLWALFRRQSVACPISPRFPEETLSTILEETGCKTVIEAVGGLSGISPPVIRRLCLSDLFDTMTRERRPPEDDRLLLAEPAGTIVLTSGSSGGPKAVLHNLSSHYWSAVGSNGNIPVTAGTRWLLSLPLYHVGGLGILFRTFLGGGAIVIPPSHTGLPEVLDTLPVTHLSLVATQLYRLLRAFKGRPAWRLSWWAGAPRGPIGLPRPMTVAYPYALPTVLLKWRLR